MNTLEDLWKYQPAILKMVNRTLGPHRRHQREDLEAHCYAELTARFHQYKGVVPVWAWAKVVLKGVTVDWLKARIAEETLVAESNGADPNLRPHAEKVWSVGFDENRGGFEDVTIEPVKANKPKGESPDVGDVDDLAEWAQGDTTFMQADEVKHDEMTAEERAGLEHTNVPTHEDDAAPVEVPPTMAKIFCKECSRAQKVLQQFDREQHLPPSRDGSKDGNYALENKVSTFILECGHSREETKTLNRQWIRPSRATGKPRGRPSKLNAATTL